MNWQLLVALRYFNAKHKERFISLISLISVLGIAVGVGSLIIVISVMSGFDEDLKEKIIGTYSHLEVISDYGVEPSDVLTKAILNTKHVKALSYFLHSQALVRRGEDVTGVVVKGIVPQDEIRVKDIGAYMKEGALDLGGGKVVIGSELAKKMKLKIGDTLFVISPRMKNAGPAAAVPGLRTEDKSFKIAGIFTSGMYEYDMNLVYVGLSDAQGLVGSKNLVSGAAIKIDDLFNAATAKRDLQERLGFPYFVRTWADSNRNLLEAVKLEKTVMFIILMLIVMVACFNIASALIMTVLERTRDIGIFKAIGANNLNVMTVFAIQGTITGFLGTALGTAMGLIACWCLKTYKFISLPRDIYYIDKLPVKLEPGDLVIIICSSIIISIISALYPAFKASQLDPVEALRYE